MRWKNIWISITAGLCGFAIGTVYMLYHCGKILDEKQQRVEKFQNYFEILNLWMERKENHYNLQENLLQKNIHSVAIYGMGKLGRHLRYELNQAGIEVAYVIDQSELSLGIGEITQYSLEDSLPLVDAIIVTPIQEYEKIKGEILKNNVHLRVVSLKTILG